MTARKLAPGKLVIASHNAGKAREINDLMAPHRIIALSADSLGLAEPEETETTFSGNAALKARAAASAAALPALADDSGLEVAALGGAPGIYSARWAGTGKDFGAAMERVRQALDQAGGKDRSARFVCALALAWPDGHTEIFEGTIEGALVFPPRGTKGFGYDPIFLPKGETETFGEMAPARKHAMSHRAKAFAKLTAACLP
ncbi:MAG: RdgB/HAM1 family non-canonical purine NTP pyrophosphatase [Amphiplicatus sp.]